MKSIIVTGASGNLGKAVVAKFLSSGFKVIGIYGLNDKILPDEAGINSKSARLDLRDEAASEAFIDNVIDKEKMIDVAVLTVGGFEMGDISSTSSADIKNQYQLNFETTYNIARPIFKQMLKQGSGRIFLTGARPGLDSKFAKGMVGYSLSKSLIFRLAEIMNEESAGKDVVTSVIVPSVIDTPQNRKSMPDSDPDTWIKPESIAELIFLYCTPKAGLIRQPVIKIYGNV